MPVELVLPETPEGTNLEGKSWLLCAFARFPDRKIYAFGARGLTKSDELRLFENIEPKEGGIYTVELGAILPDRFSSLNGQLDYVVDAVDSDGTVVQVCVSNQMCRLRYKFSEDQFVHALCPRFRLDEIMTDESLKVPEDTHVEYLSTVVTCRFEILGENANDALEAHLEDCIERMMGVLNRLVSAHLMLSDEHHPTLVPAYDQGSFDYLYFMVEGNDAGQYGAHRITPNVHRSALNVPNYDEEQAERFIAYANGAVQVDEIVRIMKTCRGYLDGGLVEFAMLQLAIAAEKATHRFTSKMFEFSGVSKSKLDDMEKDMTFSRALNVDVMALCPPGFKPDRELIGQIDKVRKYRNEFMHRANFQVAREELRELYAKTEEYIQHLNKVLEYRGLS